MINYFLSRHNKKIWTWKEKGTGIKWGTPLFKYSAFPSTPVENEHLSAEQGLWQQLTAPCCWMTMPNFWNLTTKALSDAEGSLIIATNITDLSLNSRCSFYDGDAWFWINVHFHVGFGPNVNSVSILPLGDVRGMWMLSCLRCSRRSKESFL